MTKPSNSLNISPAWAGIVLTLLLAIASWAFKITNDVSALKAEVDDIHSAMGLKTVDLASRK